MKLFLFFMWLAVSLADKWQEILQKVDLTVLELKTEMAKDLKFAEFAMHSTNPYIQSLVTAVFQETLKNDDESHQALLKTMLRQSNLVDWNLEDNMQFVMTAEKFSEIMKMALHFKITTQAIHSKNVNIYFDYLFAHQELILNSPAKRHVTQVLSSSILFLSIHDNLNPRLVEFLSYEMLVGYLTEYNYAEIVKIAISFAADKDCILNFKVLLQCNSKYEWLGKDALLTHITWAAVGEKTKAIQEYVNLYLGMDGDPRKLLTSLITAKDDVTYILLQEKSVVNQMSNDDLGGFLKRFLLNDYELGFKFIMKKPDILDRIPTKTLGECFRMAAVKEDRNLFRYFSPVLQKMNGDDLGDALYQSVSHHHVDVAYLLAWDEKLIKKIPETFMTKSLDKAKEAKSLNLIELFNELLHKDHTQEAKELTSRIFRNVMMSHIQK